jgi:hypothetical protein
MSDEYPEFDGAFDSSALFDICEFWTEEVPGPVENEPVKSDIPTLILAGEYDPITPPDYGRQVSADLANSHFLELPGVGHGVSVSGECGNDLVLSFLDDPGSVPASATCVSEMGGPDFVVSSEAINLVHFESAMFGISGLVPEGWVEVAPGTYARSALGVIAILEQAAPGVSAQQMLFILSAQLRVQDVPVPVDTREGDNLSWTLYSVQTQGQVVDIALSEDDGVTYVAILFSIDAKRDIYYDSVFLPVTDALGPLN